MPEVKVNNAKIEFERYLKKWCIKDNRYLNGVDVGCGTSRIDPMIPSIDNQPNYMYAHNQYLWDCKDLELFNDNKLDFIFSSHCLEDFADIPTVFENWWKKLKADGLMLLLLPDMEGGRYNKVEDVGGNPSHKTNAGKSFMHTMLEGLKEQSRIKDYEIVQEDTIPHTESCSIDFVIKKRG